MNRQSLRSRFLRFLRDHNAYTAAFFLNGFLLTLFYSLSVGELVEVVYPASISLFVYACFLAGRWMPYNAFLNSIERMAQGPNNEADASTHERRDVIRTIRSIHQFYQDRISGMELRYARNRSFLSQWIHNLKTPVSIIDLLHQKSARSELSPSDALKEIGEENARLSHLLEQVLNLLRLEDFARDYLPEPVNLAEAVRTVINRRKNQFIHSKVFPKLQVDTASPLVLTDPKWNEAMLDQLVSNAIKYSSDGAEEPAAKTVHFRIESAGEQVLLSIRDEGIGIPECDLGRVFEPFFTGQNGRSRQGATGIGLYFCREVAARLGHTITLTSRVGTGTEVRVSYLAKL